MEGVLHYIILTSYMFAILNSAFAICQNIQCLEMAEAILLRWCSSGRRACLCLRPSESESRWSWELGFFLGGGGNDKLEGQTLRLGSLKLNFLSNWKFQTEIGYPFFSGLLPAFFVIFVFLKQSTMKKWIKFCCWLDLNRVPLVLEATALPTESHQCPQVFYFRLSYPQIILLEETGTIINSM